MLSLMLVLLVALHLGAVLRSLACVALRRIEDKKGVGNELEFGS